MVDRIFTMAFGVSLGIHLVLLVVAGIPLGWSLARKARLPLEVIYEQHNAQEIWQHLQAELARTARSTVAGPSPPPARERTQISIPSRPLLIETKNVAELLPERSPVVDLTNLVDAARGNPVLLGYFSAIRHQIQQTADSRSWLAGTTSDGLVCIAFTLTRSGTIHEVTVVAARSSSSQELQDVALTIVRLAAPFPPFPPSVEEPSRRVVVPLEFRSASSSD